jgi:hypothetical protein
LGLALAGSQAHPAQTLGAALALNSRSRLLVLADRLEEEKKFWPDAVSSIRPK